MCAVDAPEAVVDMNSPDLISLGPFPDKVGLFGHRIEAAMSRIMKGRDCRSVRFVVPDVRLVDRGFHDVTVVDMEDDREPTVVLKDMTRLRELWPVEVFEPHEMPSAGPRANAEIREEGLCSDPTDAVSFLWKGHPGRYVSSCGPAPLDLVQLCPIAWCTTWKGSPRTVLNM